MADIAVKPIETLDDAQGRLDYLGNEIKSMVRDAGGKFTSLDMKSVELLNEYNGEMKSLREQITKFKEAEKAYAEFQNEEKKYADTEKLNIGFQPKENNNRTSIAEQKTLGELFVESAAFTTFDQKNGISQTGTINTHEFKTVFQTTTDNSGIVGFAPQILRNGVLVLTPTRSPKVDLVLPTIRVDKGSIMYQQELTYTDGSGSAHEDDSTNTREAALRLGDATETIKKLRVYIPIADDMMDDAPFMINYVNQRLSNMLMLRKDTELINGDGIGDNVQGLLNRSGIVTRSVSQLGANPLEAIHRGLTLIKTTTFDDPDAILINPIDLQEIKLMKTDDGVYILTSPTNPNEVSLWGLKTVSTTGIPENTAMLGAFQDQSAQLLRKDMFMTTSKEYNNGFMSGRLSIKLEMRLGLVLWRPSSFLKLTGV